jgi:hypothetical protein
MAVVFQRAVRDEYRADSSYLRVFYTNRTHTQRQWNQRYFEQSYTTGFRFLITGLVRGRGARDMLHIAYSRHAAFSILLRNGSIHR